MVVGNDGRVTPGTPNRLRTSPSLGGDVSGEIPGNGIFTVLSGPVCADGYAWWFVEYQGTTGWTAESGDGEYWLVPR